MDRFDPSFEVDAVTKDYVDSQVQKDTASLVLLREVLEKHVIKVGRVCFNIFYHVHKIDHRTWLAPKRVGDPR